MASSSNMMAFSVATPLFPPRGVPAHSSLRTSTTAFTIARRRPAVFPLRMTSAEQDKNAGSEQTSEADEPQQSEQLEPASTSDAQTTSAADILKSLREDSAADSAKKSEEDGPRSMLGVYRDVDGRSNVWAVEPAEQEDTRPQLSKTALIAAAAGFIIIALLVLPLLPFTNPDQL